MREVIRRVSVLVSALTLVGVGEDSLRFALPPGPAPPMSAGADTLFTDDFSGGLSRWQPDQSGVWSLAHGMLRADLPDQKQLRSLIYAGSESWKDYALDFDVCMMRGVDKGAVVRVEGQSGVGVDLRGGSYQDVVVYLREWLIGRAPVVNADAAWNHVRIEVRGSRYKVYVNKDLVLDRMDRRRTRGRVALAAYTGGSGACTVWYDNVHVTPLN